MHVIIRNPSLIRRAAARRAGCLLALALPVAAWAGPYVILPSGQKVEGTQVKAARDGRILVTSADGQQLTFPKGTKAVVFARDDKIRPEALTLASGTSAADGSYSDRTLREALNIFKKHFITKALEANGWHQTRTAKALAIQRSYLSKLVKELGIMKERGV